VILSQAQIFKLVVITIMFVLIFERIYSATLGGNGFPDDLMGYAALILPSGTILYTTVIFNE